VVYTGMTLVRSQDYDTAIKLWEQTLRAQPNSAFAMNNLAAAYLNNGSRLDDAEELIERLDAAHPDYLKTPLLWGRLWFEKGDFTNAEVALREAVLREPDEAQAHAMLGGALALQDKMVEAEASIRRAFELNPNEPTARNLLGVILAREGRPADAVEVLRGLVDEESGSAGAAVNLAIALNQLGRTDKARERFAQGLEMFPESIAIRRNFADFEAGHGNLAEAETLYRQVIADDDQNVPAAVGLGIILRDTGRLEEAELVYSSALRVSPGDPLLLNNYGVLLATLGRYEDAYNRFGQALANDPEYEDAKVNRELARSLLPPSHPDAVAPPADAQESATENPA
ncbi:MAG: tetratricopeptide repeat protein, partial [Planctomycetota bacterium]